MISLLKRMTKVAATLGTLSAVMVVAVGAQAADLVKVRVAVNASTSTVPILMGIDQGIFKAHGLDLSYEIIPNITLIPAGLGNTWDFGFSVGPITINAANSGIPVVAAVGLDRAKTDAEDKVVAKPDIKSIADLKGKRIGAPTLTGNINLATKAWLRANGVDPQTVRFVQVPTPSMLDQLNAGLIDAAEIISPYDSQAMDKGYINIGDPIPTALGIPVAMTWWAANKDWLAENPETLVKFRDAMKETYAWVADHQKESKAALAKLTGMADDLVKNVNLSSYDTAISVDDMQRWMKLMVDEGGFKPKIDAKTLVP